MDTLGPKLLRQTLHEIVLRGFRGAEGEEMREGLAVEEAGSRQEERLAVFETEEFGDCPLGYAVKADYDELRTICRELCHVRIV